MAPVREWVELSSRRWAEESGWRREPLGVVRARIQAWFQHRIGRSFERALEDYRGGRAHRAGGTDDWSSAAPTSTGTTWGIRRSPWAAASALARTGISGVAAILPFTCLPGTIVASLSASFRRDHDGLPWVDIAYDGQEDTGIATRLQAFVHQAREYCRRRGYDRPRVWNRTSAAEEPTPRSVTSGMEAFSRRSMPCFRVSCDMGQPPQAPFRRTLTTPSSVTSTSSTSPPSACRPGRMDFRASSTFSRTFNLRW